MKQVELPKLIHPWHSCDKHESIEGTRFIKDLTRLPSEVMATSHALDAKIEFSKDNEGFAVVEGVWKAVVSLSCQRCLQPFDLPIEGSFLLALVEKAQDYKRLPERFEPLVVSRDAQLNLNDLLIEEILLKLPLVPKHEDTHCFEQLNNLKSRPIHEDANQNPFEGLHVLKTQ